MKLAWLAVQPRASQRSMSFSTTCTASSATLPALSVGGPDKSCMKVSTHALSLKRVYGKVNELTDKVAIGVTWSTVEINSHEVILGDHPGVSSGPPVTIKWTAFESVELTVEEYEERHPPHRSYRDLSIPRHLRQRWLRNQGYTRQELKIAAQAVKKTKKRRRSSARDADGGRWRSRFQQWIDVFEWRLEGTTRAIDNAICNVVCFGLDIWGHTRGWEQQANSSQDSIIQPQSVPSREHGVFLRVK
jgi:hypothetical protein